MRRILKPELLDTLPADDPRAIGSRRDLRRVNALMGNAAICQRAIDGLLDGRVPRKLIELGCGDAEFLAVIARRKSLGWNNLEVWLVDRIAIVSESTLHIFREAGWTAHVVNADVFDWMKVAPQADICLANLFLHHFAEDQIATLLIDIASHAAAFAACEPRRSVPALWASHALWLLGCNAVTRHDAVVSVRAGFASNEISRLWSMVESWDLSERPAGSFSHLFTARRTKRA